MRWCGNRENIICVAARAHRPPLLRQSRPTSEMAWRKLLSYWPLCRGAIGDNGGRQLIGASIGDGISRSICAGSIKCKCHQLFLKEMRYAQRRYVKISSSSSVMTRS